MGFGVGSGYATGPVHEAFCRATDLVEKEMSDDLAYEGGWEEEYITIRLCKAVRPEVKFARFNKQQEGRVGADYIWWWVDRSGECFGCLIQAKNIKRDGRHWKIHFQQRSGRQLQDLLTTAEALQIPAGYMLYAGDRDYRAQMDCTSTHEGRVPCHEREGAAVTFVPTIVADQEIRLAGAPWHPDRSAVEVFCQWATPLIDITAPGPYGASPMYRRLAMAYAIPGLGEFLTQEQVGARKVARRIFDAVGRMASLQFATAVATAPLETTADCVFPTVPDLRGHFPMPYFQHILRGLRRELPPYVELSLAGEVPTEIAQQVDGLILVEL